MADWIGGSRRLGAVAIAALRDASWLTGERIVVYSAGLLCLFVGVLAVGLARNVAPLAQDFCSFYAASALALAGDAAGAYAEASHGLVQARIAGCAVVPGWSAFFYPPPFLLVCLPLALLPFAAAAWCWTLATGALFVAAVRAWLPALFTPMLVTLAAPALWSNVAAGQSSLLFAAVMAFGLRWLDRWPVASGICLGLLLCKPQFAVVVPVALAAARRGRALAGMAVAAAGLATLSLAVFGSATWHAFAGQLAMPYTVLAAGRENPRNMASVLGAALMAGVPLDRAIALQSIATVATAIAVGVFAWRRPSAGGLTAATATSAMMASPWLHYYDLALAAVPLAWFARMWVRGGARPWEGSVLVATYLLPFAGLALARLAGMPIAPAVLVALFVLIWRRESWDRSRQHQGRSVEAA
ncbi:MAG: glycosyltransferase family 87 protein [Acetobacteraceae bacterium]